MVGTVVGVGSGSLWQFTVATASRPAKMATARAEILAGAFIGRDWRYRPRWMMDIKEVV